MRVVCISQGMYQSTLEEKKFLSAAMIDYQIWRPVSVCRVYNITVFVGLICIIYMLNVRCYTALVKLNPWVYIHSKEKSFMSAHLTYPMPHVPLR